MARKTVQLKVSTLTWRSTMNCSKTPENQALPQSGQGGSGEGGIRTRGKVLPLRRFSKAVLSTTQPPLR
jgi:hypothetical protein